MDESALEQKEGKPVTREDFEGRVLDAREKLYRVARSYLQGEQDCLDAVSEAVLRAWQKRSTLRREEYFDTWLMRILMRECVNIQRRQKRVVPVESVPEMPASDGSAAALRDALATLPRGELDYDIGTDVRMNSVEAEPRYVEEELDVTQGKLVMGWRLGECMDEPDYPSLYVFNSVFGAGATSKLFVNVREKLSLCYYASSMLDLHKGLMLVASGIEFENFAAARDEIFAQLDAIKRGDITDEELEAARSCVASDLRSLTDSQGELEGFYLSLALDGLDCSPLELAELCEEVTKQDVIDVANSVECDMIYFLKGSGSDEDEDEDDDAEA